MVNSVVSHTPLAGRIDIRLGLDSSGVIRNLALRNSRPKEIGRLFSGKSPSQAVSQVGRLFMLCSRAQQAAAVSALAEQTNHPLSDMQKEQLGHYCALEWVKEHSWQLWQMERELFGPGFAIQPSLALSKLLQGKLQQLQPLNWPPENNQRETTDWQQISRTLQPLLGADTNEFIRYSWSQLLQWSKGSRAYPMLINAMLESGYQSLGAFPGWLAEQESGSLSRQRQHPLVKQALTEWGPGLATRTLARFIELACICENPSLAVAEKAGTAHASRGLLTHTLTLDKAGLISAYHIDAPTDRLFTDGGLVEQSLVGQQIKGEQSHWLRQLLWAIDPCVEFHIEISKES